MLFKIGNLNRIDWIYGILYFAFNAPFMFPKKRPSLIIKPEGINKKLVCFPDLILGRLIIQDSACLYGDFAADKGNQLCFTGYPLTQSGLWESLPPIPGFLYLTASLAAPSFDSFGSHALNASTKSNLFIISGDL